jgi:subtilisin family serine protease
VSESNGGAALRRTILKKSMKTGSAVIAAGALVLAGIAFPASAAPPVPGTIGVQQDLAGGSYIVTLVEEAVATYEGGVPGFDATAPEEGDQLDARLAPVQDYSDYLADQQQEVADSVGAQIDASYTMAVNAFAADLSAEQATALASDRNVLAVSPNDQKKVTAVPSTDFLGLSGDDGVWAEVGGAENAGAGIVVGVLDTGLAPENPAFAGDPLGTTPGDAPYLDGDVITFAKADGTTFTGVCQTGEQFTADDCNTKVIGARYFVDGFGVENLGDASTGPGEFVSPRDGDGHGSHTSSTAAGNVGTPAMINGVDFGTYTGVAPGAKIAMYKVCWSGPDPASQDDDSCTTSDILAGIDAAVSDGVDVINYSIGGGAAQTTYSVIDDAFLGAAASGIFVSASAGNDGPGASTLDNASPWITTVAASTIPSYEGTVTLGDGQAFAGASITLPMDGTPVAGDLVNATAVALPGAVDARLCAPGSLDDALVTETTIVVCERGVYDRVAKSAEVARVGGLAMVMVNVVAGSIDTDFHSVPSVHLDAMFHDQVVAYAATAGATASLAAGNTTDYSPPTPQVAGFSSRGPVLADGSHLLKPDIAAPGVSILAAGPNQQDAEPTSHFLSGTSMAAPHIAGLAALYLGVHPNASPMEVKSAMMTTAYDTVDSAGGTVTDPFAQGAGHVDPTSYLQPGLTYLSDIQDWAGYVQWLGYDVGVEPIAGYDLNLASFGLGTLTAPVTVHREVTSTEAGTWDASVDLPGFDVVVEPSTLTFGAAGETQPFTVTFSRTDAPLDTFSTGFLTWSGPTQVRSPIAVQPRTIVAPHDAEGTGVAGSVGIEVTPGGTGPIELASTGLSVGAVQSEEVAVQDQHYEYTVTVPEGAVFARFDLDALDDELASPVDFDLFVYRLEGGVPVALWQSATGAADERVDLEAPAAADYLVDVHAYDTAGQDVGFNLTTASVVPGGAPIGLEPPVLDGVQGEPISYTASWSGLQPFTTYLGLVTYGDSGAYTALQVVTGDGPLPGEPVNLVAPSISGKAEVGKKLTADPGEWDTEGLQFAYQWQADGADIPGATGKKYTVTAADQGKVITVVVTATKGDLPPGSATSAGVTVKWKSSTSLSLSRTVLFSWQRTTATVTVDSGAEAPPTGDVTITLNGQVVATVPLVDGVATYQLPQKRGGIYQVRAEYGGDDVTNPSKSSTKVYWVVF